MARSTDVDDIARLRAALARIARHLDRRVSNEGLTHTEMSVLSSVAVHREMRAGDLAEVEGLNPTMLSRVLGRLESAGLVRRTADDSDRRSVQVTITAKGAKLRRRRLRERGALLAERLDELPPETSEQLFAALDALEQLADALSPAPRAQSGAATTDESGR